MIIYTNKETTGIVRLFNEIVGVARVLYKSVCCIWLIIKRI